MNTDVEIKDYVIFPHGEDNRISPRTLLMDVTMTHDHYGRTTQRTNGVLSQSVIHWSSSMRVSNEGFFSHRFVYNCDTRDPLHRCNTPRHIPCDVSDRRVRLCVP